MILFVVIKSRSKIRTQNSLTNPSPFTNVNMLFSLPPSRSVGQVQLLATVLGQKVVVEEVDVETGLDYAAAVNDPVMFVVGLVIASIDPVENV